MDQEIKPTEEVKPPEDITPVEQPMQQPIKFLNLKKTDKFKKPLKIIAFVIIGLLIIAGSAGAGYIWRDTTAKQSEQKQADEISTLQKAKASLEKQLADKTTSGTSNTNTNTTACTEVTPGESTLDNIKASIISGNTAALEGYMATSVNVALANSDGSSAKTATQAVAAITDFISASEATWNYNFSLSATTLASYRAGGFAKYFPTASLIGKNMNNKVISFSFDCNGKISTVFMATSEDLLI